jgi:hypothetical protein
MPDMRQRTTWRDVAFSLAYGLVLALLLAAFI